MCEKPSAFELFHSFWSFINILWGLVHKECNFDEKTRCGKNRPFFIDFFKKPYNLTLRSRQGVKIRLNTINMLEKVQLKAPPRLPKSFGQIRESFFLVHVSQWTDSIPVWTVANRKKEPTNRKKTKNKQTERRNRHRLNIEVILRRMSDRPMLHRTLSWTERD